MKACVADLADVRVTSQNLGKESSFDMEFVLQKNPPTSKARKVRDLVLLELKQNGFPLSEIATLLGFSRQRAAQIHRRLVGEGPATWEQLSSRGTSIGSLSRRATIHTVTTSDFAGRLERLNAYFESRVRRVLQHLYKRQLLNVRQNYISTTMFGRVWPLIERYRGKPFTFSQLVADHPELIEEKHLAQFLSRLRRKGVLANAGSLRFSGHNLPEVLMVERPREETCSRFLEALFSHWSRELQRLDARYKIRDGQSLRRDLLAVIKEFGFSEIDLDTVLLDRYVPTTRSRSGVAKKSAVRKMRTTTRLASAHEKNQPLTTLPTT